jgi:hypothetical protein
MLLHLNLKNLRDKQLTLKIKIIMKIMFPIEMIIRYSYISNERQLLEELCKNYKQSPT